MTKFEIRDEFYLDGKPFKILSGAIQYFAFILINGEKHSTT